MLDREKLKKVKTSTPKARSSKVALGRGLESLLGGEKTTDFSTHSSSFPKVSSTDSDFKDEVISTPEELPIKTAKNVTITKRPSMDFDIAAATQAKSRIWPMPIEKIRPCSKQPRKHFNRKLLEELSQSIKEHGVLQPIIVKQVGEEQFEIIAGERRWRASQMAGLHSIPAIIKEISEQQSLELALIENIQRCDLNPIEEAQAYKLLADEYGMTQQALAQRVGKPRATLANTMRLLDLHPEVRNFVITGELLAGHAKHLLSIPSLDLQYKLACKAVRKKLTVRQVEDLVKTGTESTIRAAAPSSVQLMVKKLAEDLQKALGTKVNLDYKAGKGQIKIRFYSDDELNELSEHLKKPKKGV